MPKSKKQIEKGVRERFLEAVDEVKSKGVKQGTSYKEIFESIDSHQQVHSQMKQGLQFPTVKQLILFHKKYGYSFQWLMLGIGAKKTIQRTFKAPDPLDLIEEGLSILKQKKKKVSSTK
jgi:hypothetical protein